MPCAESAKRHSKEWRSRRSPRMPWLPQSSGVCGALNVPMGHVQRGQINWQCGNCQDLTMATAISAMVCAASGRVCEARFWVPYSLISILIYRKRVGVDGSNSRIARARNQQLNHAAELPLVRILEINVGRNLLHRRGSVCRGRNHDSPVNGQGESTSIRAGPGGRPNQRASRRDCTQSAVIETGCQQIGIHQVTNGSDRRRSGLTEIVGRLSAGETSCVAGGEVQLLLSIKRLAEIVSGNYKDDQQRQRHRELKDLRA